MTGPKDHRLDEAGFERVLRRLEALGFQKKARRRRRPLAPGGKATGPMLGKLAALARSRGMDAAGLGRYLTRMGYPSAGELTVRQCQGAIEGLKQMGARDRAGSGHTG